MREYIKHLLIRTPFEEPAQKIQYFIELKRANKCPELKEIYYEPMRIKKVMQQVIGLSSNCIDIGCYLGSVLSQILRLSPQGKHMAFEPIPNKASWLRKKFPDVDIKEIALSDKSEKIPFYINKKCSGFSGIRQHKVTKNNEVKKIIVKSEKLDNILDFNHRVDFIKVDVEGAELLVLQGATRILNSYHPILLFECSLSGLSLFNLTSEKIFDFLTQHSYSVFLLKDFLENKKPLTFTAFNLALQYPFQGFNFLAIAHFKK